MRIWAVLIGLMMVGGCSAAPTPASSIVAALQVPPGFHVALYSAAVPDARALALGAHGTVFVGSSGPPSA